MSEICLISNSKYKCGLNHMFNPNDISILSLMSNLSDISLIFNPNDMSDNSIMSNLQ